MSDKWLHNIITFLRFPGGRRLDVNISKFSRQTSATIPVMAVTIYIYIKKQKNPYTFARERDFHAHKLRFRLTRLIQSIVRYTRHGK